MASAARPCAAPKVGDAHTVPRRRWLLTPLFQEGVKDGLPNLLRNLEKAVALGGDVQQSVVALTRARDTASLVMRSGI